MTGLAIGLAERIDDLTSADGWRERGTGALPPAAFGAWPAFRDELRPF